MRLIIPVFSDALLLLKARRNPKLIRKVQTVHRDGETHQQAYWVLPSQAEVDSIPEGAQLDLFDQAPAAQAKMPEPEIFYSQEPMDNPDEFTLKVRRLARMIEKELSTGSKPRVGTWAVYLSRKYKDYIEKEGLPKKIISIIPNTMGVYYDEQVFKDAIGLLASGDVGLTLGAGTVRSKYHDMPADDLVRRLVGLRSSGKNLHNYMSVWLHDEIRAYNPKVLDIVYGLLGITTKKEQADVAAGRAGAVYAIGRKKHVFKAARKNSAVHEGVVVEDDPVEQVKELVFRGGNKTYEDFIRIGKIIYQAVGLNEDDTIKRAEANHEEAVALYNTYKRKQAKVEKMYWSASNDEKDKVLDQARKDLDEWFKNEYKPKQAEYQKEGDEISNRIKELEDKSGKILEFMAKIRPMGPGVVLNISQFHYSRKETALLVKDALSVFPSEWLKFLDGQRIEFSNGAGFCQWHPNRGFKIAANWKPDLSGHDKATHAHEIAHAIERRTGLSEVCRQFIYSLADDSNNGAVKGKKGTMRSWQKGLQSEHLPDQYCGVLYDWGDTEVMSMAAGAFYDDHNKRLYRGRRYWEFILGLWAGA